MAKASGVAIGGLATAIPAAAIAVGTAVYEMAKSHRHHGGDYGNAGTTSIPAVDVATKWDIQQAEKMAAKDAEIAACAGREAARAAGEQAYRDSVAFAQRGDDKLGTVVKALADEAARNREYEARQGAQIECLQGQVNRVAAVTEKLAVESSDQRVREAETNGKINCLTTTVGMRFDAQTKEFNAALASVAGTAKCDNDKLRAYIDGNFVPAHLKLSPDDMCPTPVTCCDVNRYFNNGGTAPVPTPCCGGCGCGSAATPPA